MTCSPLQLTFSSSRIVVGKTRVEFFDRSWRFAVLAYQYCSQASDVMSRQDRLCSKLREALRK